jgi:hypothetical protein
MSGSDFIGLLLSLPLGAWSIILMFLFFYFMFLNEW